MAIGEWTPQCYCGRPWNSILPPPPCPYHSPRPMAYFGLCELCGEPMPKGEEMFKYHGYSGPCPTPPLPQYEGKHRKPDEGEV